ncbi:hypothetical protein BaRGS_00011247 [Batillaria attramentaria]|uniref:CHAT domain-containing protein n=1 Tax=Batillaria attramentaria TaxID=370345 RepID=A0ABD0LEY4_9CAEN
MFRLNSDARALEKASVLVVSCRRLTDKSTLLYLSACQCVPRVMEKALAGLIPPYHTSCALDIVCLAKSRRRASAYGKPRSGTVVWR